MFFTMANGGFLNFSVTSYATEEELLAAKPAVNTVGVITTKKVTSWTFSPTEPTEKEDGMLWIKTGNTSPAVFNALKKNAVMVNPVSCHQCVGDTFVQRVAYLRTATEWVLFAYLKTYVIKDGVLDLTVHTYSEQGVNPNGLYEGAPAVMLPTENGYSRTVTIGNIQVPEGATTFTIEYYRLAAYSKNPKFTFGGVSVAVERTGDLDYIPAGKISMDVSELAGMTVELTYESTGNSKNYYSYLKNAWFE